MGPKTAARQPVSAKLAAASMKTSDGTSSDDVRGPLFRDVDPKSIVQRTNSTGGERYEGQIDGEGKRSGKGILRWSNGNVYAGEWTDGSMSGNGTFFYAVEGDRYVGGFQDDKKHGNGKYTFANGNSYTGDFAVDKRHGRGRYSWMCGDEYEGEWREGRMHGHGVTAYANGNRYVGQFVEDRREGRGKLTCTDGLSYDGEWVANNRHGQGRLDFPTGDFYQGQWVSDKKHGHGQDRFANGNEYVGEYVANAKHGQGVMRYNNGDVYEGGWAADKMQGPGVYKFANGFVYDGEWVADMRHGTGEYRFPNGHVYRGEWANDRRHGTGRLELSAAATENAGEIYAGVWVEGKMNGDFTVTTASGDLVYSGAWFDGAPTGAGVFHLGSRHLVGALQPDATGKKGIGTIDALPAFLCLTAMPDGRTKQKPSGNTQRKTTFRIPQVSPTELNEPSPQQAAVALDRMVDRLTQAKASDDQKMQSLAETAASASCALLETLERTLQEANKLTSTNSSAKEPAVDSATVERLHLDMTALEVNVAQSQARQVEAEQQGAALAQQLAAAKKDRIDLKQRRSTAEQRMRDHGALLEKLEKAVQAATEADRNAVQAEADALAQKALAGKVEEAVLQQDAALAVRQKELADIEAAVQLAQRTQKTLTNERKARLKELNDESATVQTAIASGEAYCSRVNAECARAERALEEAEVSRVASVSAADAAIADAEARCQRAQSTTQSLQGEEDDVRAELEQMQTECKSKRDGISNRQKNLTKHELERTLHTDEAANVDARFDQQQQLCARKRATLAASSAASEATQLRRELRRKLDKELLMAETQAKFVENQLEEMQRRNVPPSPSAPLDTTVERGDGGAAGRLKRLRSFESSGTALTVNVPASDELGEQLKQLHRKIAKRREKLDALHGEALLKCEGWLPSNDPHGTKLSTLGAASRESQMHQVMKLRSQYERIAGAMAMLAASLERTRDEAEDFDENDSSGDVPEDPQLRDEDRFVRQIADSMKAEARDWRCNYLLDQIEARRKQILELSDQAKIARALEKRLNEVNSAISGFKSSQPRSAGPRPVAESPLGLPPRSKPW